MKFKIITINLRHDIDYWEKRLPLVAYGIKQEKPDLVAFQEVSLIINQGHQIANMINTFLNEEIYDCIVAPRKNGKEGIAFLIKKYFDFEYDTLPLDFGDRIAQKVVLSCQKIKLEVINIHLHHLPKGDETIRVNQIKNILRWANQPNILLGDYNSVPDSKTILYIKKNFSSAYEDFYGVEPKFTFPTPIVNSMEERKTLDYIFYSKGVLNLINAQLVFNKPDNLDNRLFASDHYGLMAQFSITN